jgi:hypothetical protein
MDNTIEINGIKYQRISEPNENGEPYVIVRCRNAGVHAGYLVRHSGCEVQLRSSRRCWQFTCGGIGSCSELALNGLTGKSRIAPEIPGSIFLLDACEILPATAKACDSIRGYANG